MFFKVLCIVLLLAVTAFAEDKEQPTKRHSYLEQGVSPNLGNLNILIRHYLRLIK